MTRDEREAEEIIATLRETVQSLMDKGWHFFDCPKTRSTSAECTCGWTRATQRAEHVLRETL